MAKPSVSIIQSIFSACGMWKSGSSTPADRIAGAGGYRLAPAHVPVPLSPAGWRSTSWSSSAIVTMVNLGFWQLRRLDERKAFERRRDEPGRLQPPAPLDDVLVPGADRPRSSGGRSRRRDVPAGRAASPSSTGPRTASPAQIVVTPLQLDDGRILLVVAGLRAADAPIGARAPARSRSSAGCSPSKRRAAPAGSATPATGELTEAQRMPTSTASAPQLPGEVVPMYVELTSSAPPEAEPFPQPADAPRADRRARTCRTPCSGSSSRWPWSSAGCWRCATLVRTRRRRGTTSSRRRSPRRQPTQQRRHRPHDLARRGVDAQVGRPVDVDAAARRRCRRTWPGRPWSSFSSTRRL